LDDHAWWVGVIEFQPSGWSKGSYLNVAASYLWKPAEPEPNLSFDTVLSPRPWRKVIEGESFAGAAMELASFARENLINLREYHRSVLTAAEWLQSEKVEGHCWRHYHLGVAFGLSGKVEIAQRHFRLAVGAKSDIDWVTALRRECARYAALVEDRAVFRLAILERIRFTRAALKLPALDPQDL
jgi:hypothetical protein